MNTRPSGAAGPRPHPVDQPGEAAMALAGTPPITVQQRLAEKYAAPEERRPIHHSPLFWVGVVLFVLAISVYVFTDSLAWMPLRSH